MVRKHGTTLAALLIGAVISFQNCSSPLTESVSEDGKLRVLGSPTPMPTPPPVYSTPTPAPMATPLPTPLATPLPTPVPVVTEFWSRFHNPSTFDHKMARESSPPAGYNQEGGWRFIKSAPNMNDLLPVYQCSWSNQSMLTTNPSCEQIGGGTVFGAPVPLGIYVYKPGIAQPANTLMLYRRDAPAYGWTMATQDPNEGPYYTSTIPLGWVYAF